MSDDRFDRVALAAQWYGHVLGARPHMLDHNSDPASRVRVLKVLLADAGTLLGMADTPTPDPLGDLPADAADYLRCLCKWGPLPVSGAKGGEARRVLLKAGLGSWQGDDVFAATDRGRALAGEPEAVRLVEEDATCSN